MRDYQIEAWALEVIDRVNRRQPNEDSRVELKSEWTEPPEKVARQIAGHANAQRGSPILWLIGVDQDKGVLGADAKELAIWWPQVQSKFESPCPELRNLVVPAEPSLSVVALYFECDRVPYVVKNPAFNTKAGGCVEFEVPWREGNITRSARHADLLRLLSTRERAILRVAVGTGRGFTAVYPFEEPVRRPSDSGPRHMMSPPLASQGNYGRVCVTNIGHHTAQLCRAYLTNVEFLRGDAFEPTIYTDYLRLTWSNYFGVESMSLLRDVPHWLDVVATLEHDPAFFLQTNPASARYRQGFGDAGIYRFTVAVFAENADPVTTQVYLDWRQQWGRLDLMSQHDWDARRT